jgi:hypothetical protein
MAQPGAKSAGSCLHTDLTLIEVTDAELLQELRADRSVGPLIIAQLSDRIGIAAPGSGKDLIKHLRKAGHTPKVVGTER